MMCGRRWPVLLVLSGATFGCVDGPGPAPTNAPSTAASTTLTTSVATSATTSPVPATTPTTTGPFKGSATLNTARSEFRLVLPDGLYGGSWTLRTAPNSPALLELVGFAEGTVPQHQFGDQIGIRVTNSEPALTIRVPDGVPAGEHVLCLEFSRQPFCVAAGT